MPKQEEHVAVSSKQQDSSLAIISMVLGIVSLTGPGLLLGIPAIITAIIALKKKLGGRGLSITGLVTGIVSTVVSLLFCLFVVFLILWGIAHPEDPENTGPSGGAQTQQEQPLFNQSRT